MTTEFTPNEINDLSSELTVSAMRHTGQLSKFTPPMRVENVIPDIRSIRAMKPIVVSGKTYHTFNIGVRYTAYEEQYAMYDVVAGWSEIGTQDATLEATLAMSQETFTRVERLVWELERRRDMMRKASDADKARHMAKLENLEVAIAKYVNHVTLQITRTDNKTKSLPKYKVGTILGDVASGFIKALATNRNLLFRVKVYALTAVCLDNTRVENDTAIESDNTAKTVESPEF